MRRIIVLAALAAGLCACGSTAASPMRIEFWNSGGNIAPFEVTITPTGWVGASPVMQHRRHRLSHAKVVSLSHLVRLSFTSGLRSRQCPGTNPDVSADTIRAAGRTVTVHGGCEPRFTKLWNTLAGAVASASASSIDY